MTGLSSFSRRAPRPCERFLGAEALQQIEGLQAEHHADKQPREHDDDERAGAGVVDLVHQQTRPSQRRHAFEEQLDEKDRHGSEPAHAFEDEVVPAALVHHSSAANSCAA